MPIKLPTFTPVVVANRYHLKGAELAAPISVQRPGPLGNRWRAKDVGLGPALSLYRAWLDQEYHTRGGPAYQELMRLAWIEPLVITCTCLPRSCHAQIVAEYIERLRKELATLHAALPADVDQDDDGF